MGGIMMAAWLVNENFGPSDFKDKIKQFLLVSWRWKVLLKENLLFNKNTLEK